MPSVLFVCTMNQCRSPVAEALFQARLASQTTASGETWQVGSAGTWAEPGFPAVPGAVEVMARRGLDLRAHRSRQVDREMLERYNLILVMERRHAEALRVDYPHLAARTQRLSALVGQHFDIHDPVGGDLAGYETTARIIERILADGHARLVALASGEVGSA